MRFFLSALTVVALFEFSKGAEVQKFKPTGILGQKLIPGQFVEPVKSYSELFKLLFYSEIQKTKPGFFRDSMTQTGTVSSDNPESVTFNKLVLDLRPKFIEETENKVNSALSTEFKGEDPFTRSKIALEIVDDEMSKNHPITLYAQSRNYWKREEARYKSESPKYTNTATSVLESLVRRGEPLTVVLVPGFTSELTASTFFGEALEGKNSKEVTDFIFGKNEIPEDERLNRFNSTIMLDEKVPVSELVRVFSVNKVGTNNPLFRVVHLNSPFMSFETISDVYFSATRYLERLDVVFNKIGAHSKNIVFVGHSRGTIAALEIVRLAKKKNKSWFKGVKALVSLGGVAFGTEQGDEAFADYGPGLLRGYESTQTRLRDALFAWAKDLKQVAVEVADGKSSVVEGRAKFFGLISVLAMKLKNLDFQLGKVPLGDLNSAGSEERIEKILRERFNNKESLEKYLETFKEISQTVSSVSAPDSLDILSWFLPKMGYIGPNLKILLNVLSTKLEWALSDKLKFARNLNKIASVVEVFLEGVRQLGTEDRLRWWLNSEFPYDQIRLFSLPGTMALKSQDKAHYNLEDILIKHQGSYNLDSPEYKGKTGDYKNFTELTYNILPLPIFNSQQSENEFSLLSFVKKDFRHMDPITVNDGSVNAARVIFWDIPSLRAGSQRSVKVNNQVLGILNVDHLGLAYDSVYYNQFAQLNAEVKSKYPNPFPREALLRAIADYMAIAVVNSK